MYVAVDSKHKPKFTHSSKKDEKMSEEKYINETDAVAFLRSVANITKTKGKVRSVSLTISSFHSRKKNYSALRSTRDGYSRESVTW